MKRHIAILLVLLAFHTGCNKTYPVYSGKYLVSFSCDISQPPYNVINTLGLFLTINERAQKDGYTVTTNGYKQEIYYSEVQARVFQYGLAGLIIGKPYFNDGAIYAYDLGCPQCDRSNIRLTVKTDGTTQCPKCHTTYKLNNEGIADNGEHPLYRYQTTLNGNILTVHN